MTDLVDRLGEIVRDNLREVAALGVGYLLAVRQGWIDPISLPSIPEESRLFLTAAGFAAVVGYVAAGQIAALFESETPGDRLIEVNALRDDVIAVWELPEDGEKSLDELEVVGGPLNHLPQSQGNAYEVLAYDADEHTAVSTWRVSEPASEFVGRETVADVLVEIEDLRTRLEPRARAGQVIQQSLPGVVREIQTKVVMDINDLLRGDLTGEFGSVDTERVIDKQIPEIGKPARLAYDRAEVLSKRDEPNETTVRDAMTLFSDATDGADAEVTISPSGEGSDDG